METVSTNLRGAVHESVDAALRSSASEVSGGGSVPLGVYGAASRLASFAAYRTPESDSWAIFDPVVVVDGSSVDVDMGEVEFSAGKTVTCHVWKDSGGVAHAKMTSGEWSLPNKSELLASVPIVRITDPDRMGGVEQIHTGVIHLNGAEDRLASFAVYEGQSGLTMFDPIVACPPDTTLTPAAPNPLVVGTYYCHVWRSENWVYDAKIDTSSSHSGVGKPVLDVKICDIVNGADEKPVLSKQYHVGVICADARTGLRVKSAGSLKTSGMGAGQTDDVSRKVELEFTEKLTKHLAMTVTATGDGKDGATIKLDEDDSVKGTTVVTGFKSLTVYGGKLKLVASTAKIRFPIIEGSESEATVEMAVSETPVVVGSKYDESTGKFTNTVKKATVLSLTDDGDKDVFTAVKFPECPSLKDG